MPTPRQQPTTPSVTRRASLGAIVRFAAPLIMVAIIAAGYAALLHPRFAALRDLRSRRSIELEVSDLERQIRESANAQETFRSALAAKREVIDATVPDEEDVPGLFVAMDAAAQNAGVVITSMEVTREEPPASLRALNGSPVLLIGASLRSADYPRLKSFLGILASSRRLMDVLSVQFSPQAFTATIRVRAYSLD